MCVSVCCAFAAARRRHQSSRKRDQTRAAHKRLAPLSECRPPPAPRCPPQKAHPLRDVLGHVNAVGAVRQHLGLHDRDEPGALADLRVLREPRGGGLDAEARRQAGGGVDGDDGAPLGEARAGGVEAAFCFGVFVLFA